MKDKKFSALFYNNKFVLVISILLSVLIWLVVSTELAPEVTVTVKNLPVTIDYSTVQKKMGLEPFGESDFTVDVTITGKKYIVDTDDIADQIEVTANTGYVNSEGTFSLPISAETINNRASFEIVEISESDIDVYFDYPKEKEFSIEPEIDVDGILAESDYYVDDYLMTESAVITVSGPESEVNKIQKIVAKGSVTGPLTQSVTVDTDITPVTRDGSIPENITYNRKSTIVHVTIPVYKKAVLKAGVSFKNKPADYVDSVPFEISISPSSAQFGLSESKLDGIEGFEILSIDFASLKPGKNEFTVNAEDITGGVVTDGTEKFDVTVNVKDMTSVTIDTPANVEYENLQNGISAENYQIDFTEITIVGSASALASINSDDAVLLLDMSKVKSNEKNTVSVPVTIESNNCWLCGEYTASVVLAQ